MGDRITGNAVAGEAGRLRFVAMRTSTDLKFVEANATQQEQADAVKALGNP